MSICFSSPTSPPRHFWVTRRQWLFLLLRVSAPERLPKQIFGKSSSLTQSKDGGHLSSDALHGGLIPGVKNLEEDIRWNSSRSDGPMLADKIIAVLLDDDVRISFLTHEIQSSGTANRRGECVNLTLSQQELENFQELLRLKGKKAGWDLEAGLKRMNAYLKKRWVKPRSVMQ